jgi:hypothetical protein
MFEFPAPERYLCPGGEFYGEMLTAALTAIELQTQSITFNLNPKVAQTLGRT